MINDYYFLFLIFIFISIFYQYKHKQKLKMPISHKYKTLYFHIPKTAGTSIEKMLEIENNSEKIKENLMNYNAFTNHLPSYQHFIPQDIKPLVKNNVWTKYHKCVSVRNPYDRAISSYEFLKKINYLGKNSTIHDYLIKAIETKNRYKLNNNVYDSDPILQHYRPQYHWFLKDNMVYDTIIRYEYLQEDINKLRKKINCQNTFPHEQSTRLNKTDYLKYYDKNASFLLEKAFDEDFILHPQASYPKIHHIFM